MSDAAPSLLSDLISGQNLNQLGYPLLRLREAGQLLRKRVKNGSLSQAVAEFLKPVFEAAPDDLTKDGGAEQQAGQVGAAEVLLLPLFRLPALRSFWERELRRERFERLQAVLPEAWFADGMVLPPGGALPGLGIVRWSEYFSIRPGSRLLLVRLGGGQPVQMELLTAAEGGDVLSARIREAAEGFASRPAIVIDAGQEAGSFTR